MVHGSGGQHLLRLPGLSRSAHSDARLEWADERLADAGIRRAGPPVTHSDAPWAVVHRIPTDSGDVWLKACAPRTAYEVALYPVLVDAAPQRVLEPIAADAGRGWLLLPDGGVSVGELVGDAGMADALADALPAYAEIQRALETRTDDLLAARVPDMRPGVMPERFDEAIDAVGGYAELAAVRGRFAEWCTRLEVAPGGASIDHNDLHLSNVVQGRFYDWGDAVVAHPFASLLLPLTFLRDRVGTDAVPRVRDAYLESWDDIAPHAELVETVELACRVAKAARALTWIRAGDDLRGPLYCLRSILDDSYLGGT